MTTGMEKFEEMLRETEHLSVDNAQKAKPKPKAKAKSKPKAKKK